MGQLGKIYQNLNPILQEIGEKSLQSCYSSEEMVEAVSSNIDFSETKI
jgi:hypothetical protein